MDQGSVARKPALEFVSITKLFPGVQALQDVSLDVHPGEVLALVGENGAGKSTLLRVMNGDYHPEGGSMRFFGETVAFASPAESHASGVRVIYQEPEILADVTVAENIYLGEMPRSFGPVIDWNAANTKASALLSRLGVGEDISPRVRAGTLSAAQKQMVEIARAIKSDVKVLALDEPTSSLSERDSSQLFDIINQFRRDGVAIIYVSHRLPEILQLADRIAVLRDGKLVALRQASETTESELMSLMVGRDLAHRFDHQSFVREDPILKVEGLTTERVRDISFEVHRGEIVGFAGLVGAGRTELAKALFGEDHIARGRVYVPEDLMRRHGVSTWDFSTGRVSDGWRGMMAELIARTRALFEAGRPLCDRVGRELRFEMRLTWLGGASILDRIEAAGGDVFRRRPRHGALDKAALAWRAWRWRPA